MTDKKTGRPPKYTEAQVIDGIEIVERNGEVPTGDTVKKAMCDDLGVASGINAQSLDREVHRLLDERERQHRKLLIAALSLAPHAQPRRSSPSHRAASRSDDPSRAADAHHRLIWTAFSDGADRHRDFLWRADGNGRFYTLSQRPPDQNELFAPIETRPFDPDLNPGDRLSFTLKANATRDRPRGELGEDKNDRRVDVVMDLMFKSVPKGERAIHRDAMAQEAAEAWITRQGSTKGFASLETRVESYHTLDIARR